MLISVVIPTYNAAHLLKQNLPHVIKALEAYDKDNVELIVSDDHSTDDSVAYLKELQRNAPILLKVIENDKNGGFSINVNRGERAATGDILILLGSDVQPHKDFIKPLIPHFEDQNLFAVGCVNESDEDRGTDILRGRAIARWEKGFLFHSFANLVNDDTFWVDCGSGAFRRSTWNDIGGLQELYSPFYWEDVDVSYRAQKMGYSVKIEKNSRVVHEHKKGTIKKMRSDFVTRTVYRNQFLFVWLNITDRDLLLNHLLYIPYHLLAALKDRNWLFLKAFFLAVMKLNKVFAERKKTVVRYKVSDHKILARFKNEI